MGGRREVDGFHTVRSHSAGCLAPERKITEPLHACVCACLRTHGDGRETRVQRVMSW